LMLFSDIGTLEMNDPCKVCIETEVENVTKDLLSRATTLFTDLVSELQKANETMLAKTMETILAKLSLQEVMDYYSYKTVRLLYGNLGAQPYLDNYQQFQAICLSLVPDQAENCGNITLVEATLALERHADHPFSSTVIAGTPLPFYGDDGEGYLFQGNSPVSGSGIDMSGTEFSALDYITSIRSQGNATATVDIKSADWQSLVETDPIFRWFNAGETPMTAGCSNGRLKGTNGLGALDGVIEELIQGATGPWCTKFNEPFNETRTFTQQYFARMWFDLLADSPSFLNLTQGSSNPYTWTLGQGCGYSLAGQRFSYSAGDGSNQTFQEYLMANASGELYYIDEGETIGPIERTLLIGGLEPPNFSPTNPLTKVSVVQSLYPALRPDGIVERVSNCNRPDGPIDISEADAKEMLFQFKKAFEKTWSRDWDTVDPDDQVQFVGFFDDAGASGTVARLLEDITLSSGILLAASVLIIAFFSVVFLFDCDPIESRAMITLFGVLLVLISYFAAVGFGLILGIKVNINIAWTLPFIMIGLGVDDMYIVLLSLREQQGYDKSSFLAAMKEVLVPVTMTSLVNAGMFATMNVNDIPAIYLTAQVALISVVFLYLTIILCFPAWCWIDMQRQKSGRHDILFFKKSTMESGEGEVRRNHWADFLFEKIYKPIILGPSKLRIVGHVVIWAVALALIAIGSFGLTERKVGLGLEDFIPEDNQANRWATVSSEELAAWPIQINWGPVDYAKPETQMRMLQQFEDVVATGHVAEIDTKMLWMANFLIWSSLHCTENFDREDLDVLECGHDQVFEDGSTCSGAWLANTYNLREKTFADDTSDVCSAFQGGICRPTSQMHTSDLAELGINANTGGSWCPVIDNWSDEKLGFCLRQWRRFGGGGGGLVLLNETGTSAGCAGEFYSDEAVRVPIPISSSPTMYAYDLLTHERTLEMLEETRALCDDDEELHCFLSGTPYDYWSQYLGIFGTFVEIAGYAVAVGFIIAFLFLVVTFSGEQHLSTWQTMVGAFVGSSLISITTIISLVSVAGLSVLAGVKLTGFSNMSIVLSVGFSVEYSVHVVARWLRAEPGLLGLERVQHTMSFLFLPTFMSFLSSLIGVACLAFTEFEFNEVFFFRPLILVMTVTYFFGCWWLPVLLCNIKGDAVKMGREIDSAS